MQAVAHGPAPRPRCCRPWRRITDAIDNDLAGLAAARTRRAMNGVMLVVAGGYVATLVAFAGACDLYLSWDARRRR